MPWRLLSTLFCAALLPFHLAYADTGPDGPKQGGKQAEGESSEASEGSEPATVGEDDEEPQQMAEAEPSDQPLPPPLEPPLRPGQTGSRSLADSRDAEATAGQEDDEQGSTPGEETAHVVPVAGPPRTRAPATAGRQSMLGFGDPSRIRVALPGEYALRFTYQSDLQLSAVPTNRPDPEENLMSNNELGQNLYVLHWLRLRPELTALSALRIVGQVDLLHGHIGGDSPHDIEGARDERGELAGLRAEGVRPRWLFLEWDTGYGILRAGQMGSSWGMGLLANDGDRGEGYLFGDYGYGDIVERVVFATKPFYRMTDGLARELAIAVGGDLVFDDGLASLADGDLAWQAIAALSWRLDADRALGLYVAYRNQTFEDGDTLEVTAIDFYGEWSLRLAHQIYGYAEAEVVGVVGHTDAVPNLEHFEADVRQLGAAARVGVRVDSIGLDVRLEGGYASGDADNSDDRMGRFTFDPDFRVGLVLFPELLGWSTARAASLAADERLVGVPQDGVDLLPTNGGVAGAAYVYPSLTWRPLSWLDVRFALLLAQATSDVTSPFETKRRGGAASYRGGDPTRRDLGLEIDLGIEARYDFRYVALRGGLEGAYCVPGHAFDDDQGRRHPDIGLIRTRLQLDW